MRARAAGGRPIPSRQGPARDIPAPAWQAVACGHSDTGISLWSPMSATEQPPRPSRAPMSGRAIVQNQFERAADLINLEGYMRKILMSPFREVQVEVPVRMDDGRIEVFTGYRIQHNGARGPCKGGIRYHPEADRKSTRLNSSH